VSRVQALLLETAPWWVAMMGAIAGAMAVTVAGRGLQRWLGRVAAGRSAARHATGLPVLLRLWLPVAMPLAERIGPHLPIRLRERVQQRLRRAGLEEDLLPQHWLALTILLASGAGTMMAALTGSLVLAAPAAAVGGILQGAWLRDRVTRRRNEVLRDLPVYLDMVTLALEAGGALGVALRVATERAPDSTLRRAFLRVQGDLRAGRSRAEALTALADRLDVPAVRTLMAALVQAEASGASLATVLRAQADQRIEERFSRAEKLALEAPVKMLAPLVLCIFPCTFAVLAFPLLMRFLGGD
jgi:tight adherence protein C